MWALEFFKVFQPPHELNCRRIELQAAMSIVSKMRSSNLQYVSLNSTSLMGMTGISSSFSANAKEVKSRFNSALINSFKSAMLLQVIELQRYHFTHVYTYRMLWILKDLARKAHSSLFRYFPCLSLANIARVYQNCENDHCQNLSVTCHIKI